QQQQRPRPATKEAFPPRSYADDDYGASYQAGAGVGSSSSGGLGAGGAGGYHALPAANAGGWDAGGAADRVRVNKYETTLPVRVDILAALAYVLGPITGVSSRSSPGAVLTGHLAGKPLSAAYRNTPQKRPFLCSLLLAYGSLQFWYGRLRRFSCSVFSLLFWMDEATADPSRFRFSLWYKSYQDGQSLDRFHLPYVGDIAARWVDSE
ncbi:MAG: hypothetical protein BJ554DRAFT_7395, partial [Olpidium bornovanus]